MVRRLDGVVAELHAEARAGGCAFTAVTLAEAARLLWGSTGRTRAPLESQPVYTQSNITLARVTAAVAAAFDSEVDPERAEHAA